MITTFTEVTSNTATATIFLPILASLVSSFRAIFNWGLGLSNSPLLSFCLTTVWDWRKRGHATVLTNCRSKTKTKILSTSSNLSHPLWSALLITLVLVLRYAVESHHILSLYRQPLTSPPSPPLPSRWVSRLRIYARLLFYGLYVKTTFYHWFPSLFILPTPPSQDDVDDIFCCVVVMSMIYKSLLRIQKALILLVRDKRWIRINAWFTTKNVQYSRVVQAPNNLWVT